MRPIRQIFSGYAAKAGTVLQRCSQKQALPKQAPAPPWKTPHLARKFWPGRSLGILLPQKHTQFSKITSETVGVFSGPLHHKDPENQ